jgi:hypothetical protein
MAQGLPHGREPRERGGRGWQTGRVMTDYRVIFFNNLVNSYGKSFKCLQRVVTVSSTNDTEEASEKAKREFERLEDVPNWKYHAQFLEVERANATRDN